MFLFLLFFWLNLLNFIGAAQCDQSEEMEVDDVNSAETNSAPSFVNYRASTSAESSKPEYVHHFSK